MFTFNPTDKKLHMMILSLEDKIHKKYSNLRQMLPTYKTTARQNIWLNMSYLLRDLDNFLVWQLAPV